jgi:hypothetical protein
MNLTDAGRLMTKLAAAFKANGFPYGNPLSVSYFGEAVDVPRTIIGFAEAMRRLTLAENALAEVLQLSGYQMENESDSDAMASIYTRCLATLNAIRSEADV